LRAKIDTENGIGLKSDPPAPAAKKLLLATAAPLQEPAKSSGALETIKNFVGMGSTVQEKKSSAKPIDEEREKQDEIETEEDEREPIAAAASMDTKSDAVASAEKEEETKGDEDDSASSSSMDTEPDKKAEEAPVATASEKKPKKKTAASVKVKSKSKPKGGKGLGKSLPKPKRHGKNGEKKPNIDAALPRSSVKRLHYRGHKTDPKTGKIIVMKRNKHIYSDMRATLRAFLEPIIRDIAIFTEHARRKTVLEKDAHLALKRHGHPLWGSMEGGDLGKKKTSKEGVKKEKKVKVVSAEETVKALTASTPAASASAE
jgi:histone H3/H4